MDKKSGVPTQQQSATLPRLAVSAPAVMIILRAAYIVGREVEALPPISEEKRAELDQMTIQQLQASILETTAVKARGCSIYRGVSPKIGKWQAHIRISGKNQNLGTYQIQEEAARAYDRAAIATHGRKAIVNFLKSLEEAPCLEQPTPDPCIGSQRVITDSGNMHSTSLLQKDLSVTTSSSFHVEQAVYRSSNKADSGSDNLCSPKETQGVSGQEINSKQPPKAGDDPVETLPGYNVPDWANWDGDLGAYETNLHTEDPVQIQSKPWFPYNPADANSEDEFSDHEAEVDTCDICILGWTTEQLQEYIEGDQLQPALRLLSTNSQPKPDTAMACAIEASWKAFQHACKHPDDVEAWNDCEAAGNNYLNTYATLDSDDEGIDEDASQTEGSSARPFPEGSCTAFSLIQHPLVHAEQLLLKGEISAFLEASNASGHGKDDNIHSKVLELQDSIHKAEVEFQEFKGEIPVEYLHVQYQLFRKDLCRLIGKPPDKVPSKAADDSRYYALVPGQHPCVHRVRLTEEEEAQMDVEMEQYDPELAAHGGWPASRDDTIYQ